MLTLAVLLRGDPVEMERELLHHYASNCPACRRDRPRMWAMLCTVHAPVARSLIESEYIPHLRSDGLQLESRMLELDTAINALGHLEIGYDWLAKNKGHEKYEAAWERLTEWHNKIPERLKDKTADEMRVMRAQLEWELEALKRHLAKLKHGDQGLREAISTNGKEWARLSAASAPQTQKGPAETGEDPAL